MRRVCEGPDGSEAQVGGGYAHTPCRASAGSNGRAEPDGKIDRTSVLVVREPSPARFAAFWNFLITRSGRTLNRLFF